MVGFYYPKTLEEALFFRAEHNALPLAGGTDLMVRYENWSSLPASLPLPVMAVGHLKELKGIKEDHGFLSIAAGENLNEILNDPRIPRSLALALDELAAPSLRNLATLAGNIQNASPAADSVPPLMIMDAWIDLVSARGSRSLGIEEFITGPGKTELQQDEIIQAVRIPLDFVKNESRGILNYRKVGTRKANALSKLSVCFWAEQKAGELKDIRLALGAVAAKVIRLRDVEKRLQGTPLNELQEAWNQERPEYEKAIQPIDDQRSTAFYRKRTALKLLDAFIQQASGFSS